MTKAQENIKIQTMKGIAVAGNLNADIIKLIDGYPAEGMLVNIRECTLGVGGACSNTVIDLAALDGTLKLYAYGRVGNDEYGRFIRDKIAAAGVNTGGIKVSDGSPTTYNDVMTSMKSGGRTFFYKKGASSLFSPEDIVPDPSKYSMLHIGYLLSLDRFDAPDAEYGTVMARFLRGVQKAGIKTSIDVVSEQGARFGKIVPPALKYCDNVIINEIEAGLIAGIPARDGGGRLLAKNLRGIAEALLARGVGDCVYIHCPESGVALTAGGHYEIVPSLKLPEGHIKGSVGAGDAFCAGVLYGIYKGMDLKEQLLLGAASAACNLSAIDTVSGARSLEKTLEIAKKYVIKV